MGLWIAKEPSSRAWSKVRAHRTPPTPAEFARMADITPYRVRRLINSGAIVLHHRRGRPVLYAASGRREAG